MHASSAPPPKTTPDNWYLAIGSLRPQASTSLQFTDQDARSWAIQKGKDGELMFGDPAGAPLFVLDRRTGQLTVYIGGSLPDMLGEGANVKPIVVKSVVIKNR